MENFQIRVFDFLLQIYSNGFEWADEQGWQMDISSLIGGLGIGSVLTLVLKEYFDHRKIISKRAFEEKREAYINYLDASMRSQAMTAKEGLWLRASAEHRVRLCASPAVIERLNVILAGHGNSNNENFDLLIQEMKKDLFQI